MKHFFDVESKGRMHSNETPLDPTVKELSAASFSRFL